MKIKDLIEELSKYDGTLDIQIESSSGEYSPCDIESIKSFPDKIVLYA